MDINDNHWPSQVERLSIALVHDVPFQAGPDPTVNHLVCYACDKVWSNINSNDKGNLVTVRLTTPVDRQADT